MTVTPNGDLYLCKTKLENDYKNQLTWNNINTQSEYFNGTVQNTFSEYTYMKKDSTITVGANIDDIIDCNYLFYINNGFTSKRYYCFITGMTYVNENTTRINIETDCFQTWYFELQYNRCFVEREHVNNDTTGLHTIPEGLETGDYVTNSLVKNTSLNASKVILGVTVDYYFDATTGDFVLGGNVGGGTYGGIKSAYAYRYFEPRSEKLVKAIKGYADNGQSDAIGQMFIAPTFLIPRDETIIDDGNVSETVNPVSYSWDTYGDANITKPTNLNGYVPKNNKLFVYPYTYLLMTNNNGGNAIYQYELFNNPSGSPQNICNFTLQGIITPSISGLIVPLHYKGVNGNNYSESLPLPKFPICGWDTDVYTNWLTQNAVNIGVQVVSASTQIASGVGLTLATGGAGSLTGASSVLSGSTQIASLLGQIREHKMTSPQAEGNTNTGDISYSTGNTTITAYQMTIKQEYAKIIDDYFSMFGYKVNTVKVPNIVGRRNWNYIKTIDCNVDGDIPQTDLNIIKTMFNNGVTLWHNPNNMYNYSLDNSII